MHLECPNCEGHYFYLYDENKLSFLCEECGCEFIIKDKKYYITSLLEEEEYDHIEQYDER